MSHCTHDKYRGMGQDNQERKYLSFRIFVIVHNKNCKKRGSKHPMLSVVKVSITKPALSESFEKIL